MAARLQPPVERAPVVQILLIRHSDREGVDLSSAESIRLAALTDLGRDKAYELGTVLRRDAPPKYNLLEVWSSGLDRSIDTAKLISAGFHGLAQEEAQNTRINVNRHLFPFIDLDLLDSMGYFSPLDAVYYNVDLQRDFGAPALNMLMHIGNVTTTLPNGSREIVVCVTHDFVIEAMVRYLVSEDEIPRIWPDGLSIRYLEGLVVMATKTDGNKFELKFFGGKMQLPVDQDKMVDLMAHYYRKYMPASFSKP